MTLPRDLAGEEVARLLARHFEYRVVRTRGSHKVGTLDGIVGDVAKALGLPKTEVREILFG